MGFMVSGSLGEFPQFLPRFRVASAYLEHLRQASQPLSDEEVVCLRTDDELFTHNKQPCRELA